MGKLIKKDSGLPSIFKATPNKTETFAGKYTARVTKVFNHPDLSLIHI